jgi:putative FmdB family regulatory protein
MPTYEYECAKCGHRFEKFQAISAPPVKTCPRCRGRKVKRLIGTGVGILFKGKGFYQTDYRSDEYKRAARKETSGDSPKAETAEKKDAEPAKGGSPKKDAPKKDAPRKKGGG